MDYKKLFIISITLILTLGLTSAQTTVETEENDFALELSDTELEQGEILQAQTEVPEDYSNDTLRYEYRIDNIQESSQEPIYETRITNTGEHVFRISVYDEEPELLFRETIELQVTEQEEEEDDEVSQPGEPAPEPELELNVEPETIEHGDHVEARAEIEGEVREEDIVYTWVTGGNLLSDDEDTDDWSGSSVEFTANPESSMNNQPTIHVSAMHDTEGHIGREELELEWQEPEIVEEDFEVEYGTDSIDVEISEEELQNRRDFRAGTSLDAWGEITLHGIDILGGAELNFEQRDISDYQHEDYIIYNIVEVDGENIEDVLVDFEAQVDKDWLVENELIRSNREADIAVFEIDNGNWEKLDSHLNRGPDSYMSLDSDYSSIRDSDENDYLLEGDTVYAVAGVPDGINHGNFAINPQGDCERLRDNEPVPAGWEEVEVTCQTIQETDRQENQLENMIRRLDPEEEERFSEEITNARSYIADRRPLEAEMELNSIDRLRRTGNMLDSLDELREKYERAPFDDEEIEDEIQSVEDNIENLKDIQDAEQFTEERREVRSQQTELRMMLERAGSEYQEGRERGQVREDGELNLEGEVTAEDAEARQQTEMTERRAWQELGRMESMVSNTIQDLPEELREDWTYERPEEVQELYEQASNEIDDGEMEAVEQTIEELRETKTETEEFERLNTAVSTYQSIERLRGEQELEEEHIEQLDNAEELLIEEREIFEAAEIIEDVERSYEVSQVREFVMELLEDEEVRELVRDVISEVIPGF